MTTIVINERKRGAQEILELLRTLDLVFSIDTTSENDPVRLKRQKLMRYPKRYNPLALAGAAENNPLNIKQIRKEWTKMK